MANPVQTRPKAPTLFKTIGIISKRTHPESVKTSENIVDHLRKSGYRVIVADDVAALLPFEGLEALPQKELGRHCDLIVVVGGDGHLLSAARSVFTDNVPIVGINRGRLGFLADIGPAELPGPLDEILAGRYKQEERCLLTGSVQREDKVLFSENALNEVVLNTGGIARMIEFEMFINDRFVLKQRSDGLITSTPTGSTAYALSGGGPIVYPTLDAIVLVPMFPHTLSSRPLVVDGQSHIRLVITSHNTLTPRVNWDGQNHFDLQSGDHILIKKHTQTLQLIHPEHYDYFSILQQKLGWNSSFIAQTT